GAGYAGVLRGADAVVLLDVDGKELARAEAPRAPRAVSVDGARILVAGELSNVVASYTVVHGASGDAFARGPDVVVAGVDGLRGVASGPNSSIDVVDTEGALRSVDATGKTISSVDIGALALGIKRAGTYVVTMSVLAHKLTAVPVDDHGLFDGAHAVSLSN